MKLKNTEFSSWQISYEKNNLGWYNFKCTNTSHYVYVIFKKKNHKGNNI